MLKRVEGNNADRVIKLSRHEIGDDGFEVGPLDFGFAVNATEPTEAVDYQVDGLIRAVGHDRWRPTRPTHNETPAQQNRELNKYCHNLFRKARAGFRRLAVVCRRLS